MDLIIDSVRGNIASRVLYSAFSTTSIHGKNEMPEDILPQGVEKGSLDHSFFITLTVSIAFIWRHNITELVGRKL